MPAGRIGKEGQYFPLQWGWVGVKVQFSHRRKKKTAYRINLFLKGTEARTGILPDAFPTYYISIPLKTGQDVRFSHLREHAQLRIKCRYFNLLTIIDSNMSGARSNKLKLKVELLLSLNELLTTSAIMPVFTAYLD